MDRIHLYCLLFLGIVSIPIVLTSQRTEPCVNTCQCLKRKSDNHYQCGEKQSEVNILINSTSEVYVVCEELSSLKYMSALTYLRAPPHLDRFKLINCTIPFNLIGEIFNMFHVNSLHQLMVYYGSPIRATKLIESTFVGTPNLTELHLRKNRVRDLPANVFEPLLGVELLDLGDNYLSKLDDNAFLHLDDLKYLYLDSNSMYDISKYTFASLYKLTVLALHKNNVTRLVNGIFDDLVSLSDLFISFNKLTQLPDKLFARNSKLRMVEMKEAFGAEMNSLPKGLFAGLKALECVYLDANNLTTLPDDLFKGCVNLREISLRKNSLQTLPKILFHDTESIVRIDLSLNSLVYLDEATFLNLRNLCVLNLAENRIKEISGSLLANLNSLSRLDLSQNQLVDFETETFINSKNLTDVDLSHNHLTLKSWLAVSPFNKCAKLENLNLANNLLTRVFQDWRNNMTELKSLNMSFNQLTNLKATDFMFTSANREVLVDFSNNPIKTIDMSALEILIESHRPPCTCDQSSPKELRIFLLENVLIKCDCDAFHLAKFFRQKMSPVVYNFLDIYSRVYCKWSDGRRNTLLYAIDPAKLTCPA